MDAHIVLGIDATKGEQVVKSTVILPHGTGRTVRVIAFVEGDDVKKALDAGAIEAGEVTILLTALKMVLWILTNVLQLQIL